MGSIAEYIDRALKNKEGGKSERKEKLGSSKSIRAHGGNNGSSSVRNPLDRTVVVTTHRGKVKDPAKKADNDGQASVSKRPTRLKRDVLDQRERAYRQSALSSGNTIAETKEDETKSELDVVTSRTLQHGSTVEQKQEGTPPDLIETVRVRTARLKQLPRQQVKTPQIYCRQVLRPDIDTLVHVILTQLAKFQKRIIEEKGFIAKAKRRYVSGLREVDRGVSADAIRLVFIAPDSEDGIVSKVEDIVRKSSTTPCEVVFALNRRSMGLALGVPRRQSLSVTAVGIYNYDGVIPQVEEMMTLVRAARRQWEIQEESQPRIDPSTGSQEHNGGRRKHNHDLMRVESRAQEAIKGEQETKDADKETERTTKL